MTATAPDGGQDGGRARPDPRGERFERLVRDVRDPLWRYLVRRTDRDTAADVLADALTVIWTRLDDVPDADPAARLAWCYAVARNCLANARRAARRRRALVARIVLLDPPATTDNDPVGAGEPSSRHIEAVNDALTRVSPAEAELLRLWAWEELAPRQLAVVLGITPNAASIRLHRARTRLREVLSERRGLGTVTPAWRQDPLDAGQTSDEGGQPR